MELVQPFSHDHPLVFIQDQSRPSSEQKEEKEARCFKCQEQVEGPSYYCSTGCKFFLHKRCAKFELGSEINNHPFHPQHPLSFIELPPPPQDNYFVCRLCTRSCSGFVYYCDPCELILDINCATNCAELPLEINHPFHLSHPLIFSTSLSLEDHLLTGNFCNFCHDYFAGFAYRCTSCEFNLDINCALLQLSIAGDFHKLEHFSHKHPLVFNEKYNRDPYSLCNGCWKPVVGSFYRCVDCYRFDLHKECAELPLELHHSYHRKHPLTLLSNPPTHPKKCSCYLCQIEHKGFIYYCSLCNFWLNPENVSLPRMITIASHEHPWTLLSAFISFICNFCGTAGDCAPYVCITCDLVVHKQCISLPHKIKIRRHHHPISHTYFLQENQSEKWGCRICYDEVNTDYGSNCCSASDCNYIAHVKCATNTISWDGKAYVLEDKDERAKESMSLITHVIKEMTVGEDVIATEIKHEYHMHNLTMTSDGDLEDIICDVCMRTISLPFYSCDQCEFFLHKSCAELPRVKQHVLHWHELTLKKAVLAFCAACLRIHQGFVYICEDQNCRDLNFDVQCSLQPDSLSHPSHEHRLLFSIEYQGYKCSGCLDNSHRFGFRCKERCGFYICFKCITQPPKTRYKLDKHPLTLTYHDDSSPTQHYCDICEEERDPNKWFYYCADCDNSVHVNCVLGDHPFVKLESVYKPIKHPHRLKFVKKIWDCPPCHACGKLCSGKVLECLNADCKQIFHFECVRD